MKILKNHLKASVFTLAFIAGAISTRAMESSPQDCKEEVVFRFNKGKMALRDKQHKPIVVSYQTFSDEMDIGKKTPYYKESFILSCIKKLVFVQPPRQNNAPYRKEINYINAVLSQQCNDNVKTINTIIKRCNKNEDSFIRACKDNGIFYTGFAEDSKKEFFLQLQSYKSLTPYQNLPFLDRSYFFLIQYFTNDILPFIARVGIRPNIIYIDDFQKQLNSLNIAEEKGELVYKYLYDGQFILFQATEKYEYKHIAVFINQCLTALSSKLPKNRSLEYDKVREFVNNFSKGILSNQQQDAMLKKYLFDPFNNRLQYSDSDASISDNSKSATEQSSTSDEKVEKIKSNKAKTSEKPQKANIADSNKSMRSAEKIAADNAIELAEIDSLSTSTKENE